MAENLLIEREGDVAVVRLNRSDKFNALSNAFRDEIEKAFTELAADTSVSAAVLTHNGPHFSVGYDLEEVIATKLASFNHRPVEYHAAIYCFPKPLIGAYSGFALAGGFDLALGADYIVAGERSVFGHPEIKFGAPPLVTTLARKIGPAKALELIWKGDNLPSKRALAAGFINEVRPEGEVVERAVKLAQKFGSHDSLSIRMTKDFANSLFLGDVRENLAVEFAAFEKQTNPVELLARVTAYYDSLRLKQGPA
jgi:enoyl-CoA hydratase